MKGRKLASSKEIDLSSDSSDSDSEDYGPQKTKKKPNNKDTPTKQNHEFSKPGEKARRKTLNNVIVAPTGASTLLTQSQANQTSQRQHLTGEELASLYKEVVELSSGNKITVKNTWSLRLIDYIDDVLSDNQVGQEEQKTNFQKATATLDASVKIYSSRVDSVHTDTYKMLGGLSRSKADKERNPEEEGENEEYQNKEDVPVEKKKRREYAVNTLETNLNNINAKKLDLEFAVDPLFRKTSASFDNYGARSLLLINLGVHNGCEIIFDSSDAVDIANQAKKHSEGLVNVKQLKELLSQICNDVTELEICPKYSNFKFTEETKCLDDIEIESEDEIEYNGNIDFNQDAIANMDINLEEKTLANDLDAGIFPILGTNNEMTQRDISWNDGFANNDDDEPPAQNIPKNISKVLQMVDGSTVNNDYTYFNPKMLDKWAGPTHWKYQKNAQTNDEYDTKMKGDLNIMNEKKPRKKKETKRKREQFFIDFTSPSKKKKEEIEKLLEPAPKSSTTLSTFQLNNQQKAAHNLLLPPDTKFDPSSFTSLFNKPHSTILPWSKNRHLLLEKQKPVKTEWAEFGEDNSADNGDDQYDDERPGHMDQHITFANDNFDDNPVNVGGEGITMIAEPERDQRITVSYATKANFVDVKALKANLWNEICRDNDGKIKKSVPVEKSFHKVMEMTTHRIPTHMKEIISVPYYFICLLHLANENNLEIIRSESGDLSINQNEI